MASNRDKLQTMLVELEKALPDPIGKMLESVYGKKWRDRARLPQSLSPMSDLDAYAWLYVITGNWRDVFQTRMKPELRDATSAAQAGRNKYAHSAGEVEFNLTLRALLGATDLLNGIGAKDAAAKMQKLVDEMFAEKAAKSSAGKPAKGSPSKQSDSKRPTLTLTSPAAPQEKQHMDDLFGGEVKGLTAWRIACPPRDDVLEGRLNKDAFAANLATADRGEAVETYSDSVAFFNATHLTHGLELVLKSAAKRLISGDGPSTIGLQTNFGGGKTHTLLSLLHMTRLNSLEGIDTLSSLSSELGKGLTGVQSAVFVGTDKGPDIPLAHINGSPIRTIWGYLAYELAGTEGLKLVESAEVAGTNPGAEAFQKVLAQAGPSLILLDELVAYVRQLGGERYEAHLSFMQSLTEAAAQTKNTLIVGSLPESDIEAGGGEKGRETLRSLEKLFGRTQSSWQPAQGAETYAVIRRRLFQDLDENGKKARKRTVDTFRKMYRDHKGDFPADAANKEYEDQLMEAYPIHPMLFDKLSSEWGGLDKFQRTRGVLSLLARNIFATYRDASNEPLILPSSMRMNDPEVRGAILEPLEGPMWGTIVDTEVDGDTSLPSRMEQSRPRYRADQIVRRASRAVFISTAPKGDAKGGLTGPELRMSCAVPGEQISIFGDALRELSERASHLYESDGRYWFSPKPTLNKLADNRAADIDTDTVDRSIVDLLKNEEREGRGRWSRLHIAPNPIVDIEDSPNTRLVILGPDAPYHSGGGSPAENAALDAMSRRNGGQRRFRNTLVFLAPEQKSLDEARRTVRRALAWQGIARDKSLDLTESQREDAETKARDAQRGAIQSIRKVWINLLVPSPAIDDPSNIELERSGIRGRPDTSIAIAAWNKAIDMSAVLEQLGRQTLMDRLTALWPDNEKELSIDTLKDWFFEFPYMERLRDDPVLADAISAAVADISGAGLALAFGKAEDGKYVNLQVGVRVDPRFNAGQLLVRRDIADKQISDNEVIVDDKPSVEPTERPVVSHPRVATKRFIGVIELDELKGLQTVGQVFESVISELDSQPGTKFRITLEVQAEQPDGFSEDIESVVIDNAGTLGFSQRRFD